MAERTCTIDGCDRKYRAKGYCSSHYNALLKPDRHRAIITCAECGKDHETTRTDGRYCSLRCRDDARTSIRRMRQQLVGPMPWVDPEPEPDPRPIPRLWVCGPCAWCGEQFTARVYGDAPRYCSRRCVRKRAKVDRRARERGASGTYTWAEVVGIYLTLGGCAYCGQPANDLQPDHVIPLSRGGSNSLTNIVPSCGACNADKGTRLLHEWYDHRAQHGLPTRELDVRIRHLTHAMLAA